MAESDNSIFCIYLNFAGLKECVSSLKAMGIGIGGKDISVLFPEWLLTKGFETGTARRNEDPGRWRAGDEPKTLVTGFPAALTIVRAPTKGELAGALIGLGIQPYDAERYEERVKNGGILVSVRCAKAELGARVRQALCDTGAEDMSFTRVAHPVAQVAKEKTYAAHAGR